MSSNDTHNGEKCNTAVGNQVGRPVFKSNLAVLRFCDRFNLFDSCCNAVDDNDWPVNFFEELDRIEADNLVERPAQGKFDTRTG